MRDGSNRSISKCRLKSETTKRKRAVYIVDKYCTVELVEEQTQKKQIGNNQQSNEMK